MAYCTWDEIKKRKAYKVLEKLAGNGDGVIDHISVTELIADVQSEMDVFLNEAYAVPLGDPVPQIIERWAVQFCLAELYRRQSNVESEDQEKLAEKIEKKLEAIAQGKKSIPGLTRTSVGVAYVTPYDNDKYDDDTLDVSGDSTEE